MDELHVTKKHNNCINNPFPPTPKSLPFVEGSLFFNSLNLPFAQTYDVGDHFFVHWNATNGGCLSVSHSSPSERSIWSTVAGRAFVSTAFADTEVEESRGSFTINDRSVLLICENQTVESIRVVHNEEDRDERGFECSGLVLKKFPALVITGLLLSKRRKKLQSCCKYWFVFEEESLFQIGFRVFVGSSSIELHQLERFPNGLKWCQKMKKMANKIRRWRRKSIGLLKEEGTEWREEKSVEFNRICITYSSEESERFFGFGEQFSHMDFKGKRVPILVQEQGIGRGDQPITCAANCISYRSGGDWSTTYAPSPFYITSKMKSVYLKGYDYSIFDLTKADRVHIQIYANSAEGRILAGNSPVELIERFTGAIGRPPEVPNWIISGAVVGIQGGTEAVHRILEDLKAYHVPVSAFWLQDWVGHRETMIGSQLWWNWEVDTARYNGWKQLVDYLNLHQIKVMTYCNPCLAPTHDKPDRRKDHFEEAKKLDILVKDKLGRPYMVLTTAFYVGMLDLTHPNASIWFKKVLQEMVDDGVRGWMADFGEGLPIDAVLYSGQTHINAGLTKSKLVLVIAGEDPITAHNRYPELWAKINREFVDEWKAKRLAKEEDELAFLVRAGFRDSPKWGMLFWEGDQMVSWQKHDGIKSAVVGLLSGGISGFALNHSDIGGYCTVNVPFINYCRSEELLLRWLEMNAFTPLFRTHEGNKPRKNTQFYSNERTMKQFSRCAKIYKAWYFYRVQLVKEAANRGLPICRHLFLHYPKDRQVMKLTYQQFLVGTEILVVPVLDRGRNQVKAYFPDEDQTIWIHVWTGKQYKCTGLKVFVDSPIGYPAVFVKSGSTVGDIFLQNLKEMDIV